MKELLFTPQVIAATIAGLFAIGCKLLERRPSVGDRTPRRGFLGWLVIIAAVFAVVLSIISISQSRRSLSRGTWNESDRQGTFAVDGNLICYGHVEAIRRDGAHIHVEITFPEPFEYIPVVTDSVWPQGGGRLYAPYNYNVTPKGFTVHLWTGELQLTSNDPVRYNWCATGRAKQ